LIPVTTGKLNGELFFTTVSAERNQKEAITNTKRMRFRILSPLACVIVLEIDPAVNTLPGYGWHYYLIYGKIGG
jgi:hypothetical protein